MSSDLYIFKRIEKKYRITVSQKEALLHTIAPRLVPDSHGKSTVCSVYLDTPTHLLIRNSIDAKAYKEKLRIRSYGDPTPDSRVFLELKKKYKGIVYKRRVSLSLREAEQYLETGNLPTQSQIMKELDYTMHFYRFPKPKMLIAYEREAFFSKDIPTLRITFDSEIRYRCNGTLLGNGTWGTQLLPSDTVLMEIKTDGAVPLWLSHELNRAEIVPTSFSKYGTAYSNEFLKNQTQKGVPSYASTF